MAIESRTRRYRNCYSKLLRLYPKAYRERFGEGMEQTFNDLCRERVKAERGLFSFALWTFFETSAAIIRENATTIIRCFMNRGSTIFLQVVIVLIGIVALAIMIRFPLTEGRAANLDLFNIYTDPFILYGYAASIPFFIALYKAFKLLGYIGQNKAFSLNAVRTLRSIKYCAIVLCILIVMAGLYIRIYHNKEDDPAGFLAICIVTTFVSIVVATAAAIFEKILQNAIDMKSENDLTI